MSLHYLVKSGCSKFLPNSGFVTIRLLRFGVKVKRAYCRDNFLAQRPLRGMRRLSWDDFLMFQQDGTPAHQHATPSLSWSEREMREMRRRLGACVRSRGTFRARILTIVLSRSVMTTNNSANSLRRRFFYVSTGRHLNASARDTIAFLERKRYARNTSSSRRLCPFMGHILSMNADNRELICHNN